MYATNDRQTDRQTDHATEKCVAIGGIACAIANPPKVNR